MIALLAAAALAAGAAAPSTDPAAPEQLVRAQRRSAAAASKSTAGKAPRPPRALAPLPAAHASAPLPVRPLKARARPAGPGTVLYVTAKRAYLDAGADAGLTPGQALALTRAGRPAGTCMVDAVTDRSASCAAGDARGGDRFTLPAAPAARAEPGPAPKPLPPVVADAELARRRAEVEAATPTRVEYVAPPAVEARRGAPEAMLSFEHLSFFASGAQALHDERVEARVYGATVAPGWRLFLDASAWYRSSADARRFRPADAATLEVRELQVASREPDRPYTLAFGRVMPWSAPGATPFDGAQVGWRGRGFEVGAFGGAVPDVLTTGFGTERATAGAYGALERSSDGVLVRGEGRVAWVRSPELGTRIETEALVHAWLSRALDLSGQARLGFGGDRSAPGSLDLARLDAGWRAAPPFLVVGTLRYVGLLVSPTDVGAPALFMAPGRHADGSVSYDVSSAVTIRAVGGYAKDLTSGLERGYVGPELALPRLFGARGGLTAGYAEEFGWASGRSAWVQGDALVPWGLRLLLRGAFTMDDRAAPLSAEQTVGLTAALAKQLAPWLRFRLSGLSRFGVGAGDVPVGVNVFAALDGVM